MTWQPQREIEIVAGTPPGGGLDRTARALLQALNAAHLPGIAARVVNVPGDGGRKAWSHLDRFPGDPHVVSISHPNLTTDFLTGSAAFDHAAYTPLAILYTEYIAFLAGAASGIASATDLLRRMQADARSLTIALSTSLGNPNHIAVATVLRHAGADPKAPQIRVFDSALDAVADTAHGRSDVAAITAASATKELTDGTVNALAVSAPERLGGSYAGTPTWREAGVDCTIGAWRGVSGASGLAPEHAQAWRTLLSAAVTTRAWESDLDRHYWTPAYLDGAALHEFLDHERAEMRSALRQLGLLRNGA